MRRRILVGSLVGVGLVMGLGLFIWASAQGWLVPGGKARRVMERAQDAIQQGEFANAQADLEQLIITWPESPWVDDALLDLGLLHEHGGRLVEAQATLQLLLEQFPGSPRVVEAQEHLGRVNVALLFSPMMRASDAMYEVEPGDTLGEIGQRFQTTVGLIKRANRLTSDIIRPHQRLKIPQSQFGIVVDKSQNQLMLTEDNRFFKAYPVATGKNNSTPVGTFIIANKITDPVWYRQGAMVPAESPENILGSRWMGLDEPGYGIHGSVDPDGIGRQVTAGCVRMANEDVEELFAIVPRGTEVTIVD